MTIVSPTWFLLCILGLNYLTTDHIFDYLHGNSTWRSHGVKMAAWFMSAEMLVNWLLLCTVRSAYTDSECNRHKRVLYEHGYPQYKMAGMEYDELQEKADKIDIEEWSVITHRYDNLVKRMAYPYWAWKPCVVCQYYKPPRCHHCPVCDCCVIKRDHHCFFAMQCVGLNNQRFFVVFNFWAVLLTFFATPQLFVYMFAVVWPLMAATDIFLPWTVISFCLGWTEFYVLAVTFQCWSVVFFFLLSSAFLCEQISCIGKGTTPYENSNYKRMTVRPYRSLREKYARVFGHRLTWINFVLPLHWLSEPGDDGVLWTWRKEKPIF